MYRAALEIRHQEPGLGDGEMKWLELGEDVLAFSRPGNFLCIVNFGNPTKLPEGEILLSSSPVEGGMLPSDTAVWMRAK